MRIPGELFRAIREFHTNDKNGEFTQERLLRGVGKMPIAETSNDLVEMGFAVYGDEGGSSTYTRYYSALLYNYTYWF